MSAVAWKDHWCPDGRWGPDTTPVDVLIPLMSSNQSDAQWQVHGESLKELDSNAPTIRALDAASSVDGKQFVLGGLEGVGLWIDNKLQWQDPHRGAEFVDLSHDGRQVLAASADANAYLWNLDAPEPSPTVYPGHQAPLRVAVFSVDETRIATASMDGSIRVWDRASRQTILRLRHEDVRRIAFTRTGQLVSAGYDGTVRWWWLDPKPLEAAVEALDIPELTEADRERVAHLLDR